MVLDFKVNWRARRRETFRSRFFVPVSIGRNPYLLQRLLPFQEEFPVIGWNLCHKRENKTGPLCSKEGLSFELFLSLEFHRSKG